MSEKSWILYGPQGSGKTLIAKELAGALGLRHVRDEWDGRQRSMVVTNTLHIIDELPAWAKTNRRVISIDEARKRLERQKAPN